MISSGEPEDIACIGVFAISDRDIPIISCIVGSEVAVHLIVGSIVDACVSAKNSPGAGGIAPPGDSHTIPILIIYFFTQKQFTENEDT